MMRTTILTRLAVLAAGITLVASCDTRASTEPSFTGGSGSTSSPGTTTNLHRPTVVIDSPRAGALVNVGDSVLVTLRLHDDKALKNATITGYKQTGSVDLGTFSQTIRYGTVTVPPTGTFRPGLRDTTIRRYLQPL